MHGPTDHAQAKATRCTTGMLPKFDHEIQTRDCRTACRTVASRYAKEIHRDFSADHDQIRCRALWKHEDYRELHSGVTLEGVSEVGAAQSRGFWLYVVLCREVFCCLVLRHHSIVDILVSDTLPSLHLDRQATAFYKAPSYSSFVASRLASLKTFQSCLSFSLESPHMASGLGWSLFESRFDSTSLLTYNPTLSDLRLLSDTSNEVVQERIPHFA